MSVAHTVFHVGVTGLLYAAIVVVWAIFLVPMALRRHDRAARNRSVERFSSAMRVLSRTDSSSRSTSSGRVVVAPSRAVDRASGPLQVQPDTPDTGSSVRGPSSRVAAKKAMARRRRVLALLAGATVLVGCFSAFGLLPWWSCAAPLLLVTIFVWVARRQVRLSSDASWSRSADNRLVASNVVRRPAARVDASHGATRYDSGLPDRDDSDDEPTIDLTSAQIKGVPTLPEEHVVAVPMTTADGSSLWDPLPVTLPTYVDKPVARRTIRTIDLGLPDTQTADHVGEARVRATDAERDDDEAEVTQRAANA